MPPEVDFIDGTRVKVKGDINTIRYMEDGHGRDRRYIRVGRADKNEAAKAVNALNQHRGKAIKSIRPDRDGTVNSGTKVLLGEGIAFAEAF